MRRWAWDKAAVFTAAALPAAYLVWLAAAGGLGANPIRTATHFTGEWALRFLVLALAVTPVARLGGWKQAMRYRRMIGLFAFFYALLHLLIYFVLDHFFDFAAMAEDIVKRPYITIGMTAFTILLALAVTSTNKMVRRLGARRWQRLHRLAYLAGIGGGVHFLMAVKKDITEPMIYLAIIAALLLARLAIHRPLRRVQSAGGA